MQTTFEGRVWVLSDDIDTDIIIPTDYLALPGVAAMAPHAFSPLRPELAALIRPGDLIAAGRNFGCGSSREQAPEILRELKISCVIAKSFARIFFRNAVNNGLLLLEQPDLPDAVAEGDEVTVDVGRGIECAGIRYPLAPIAGNMAEILAAGGLVARMRKRNGLG
jgi:3-isopropylmalate/(R)-2-methylmalate dehydratase small subunit